MLKIYDIINNKSFNLRVNLSDIDSELDIKNKIFLSIGNIIEEDLFRYYPENIIIEKKDTNSIHFYSSYDTIYKNLFNYNINFGMYISIDDPFVKNLYSFILQENKSLSESIFLINIQYIFHLILKGELSNFLKGIKEDYIKSQETLNTYYSNIKSFDIGKNKLNSILYLDNEHRYKYNILSCVVNVSLFNNTTIKNINLLKLFKKIELSEGIPYIYLFQEKVPYLKIYKNFTDRHLLKSWVINKESNIKVSKGLNFKYKINDKYYHCNLYENGILSIIINSKIEDATNFNVIQKYIDTKLKEIYTEISKYYIIQAKKEISYRFNFHFYINLNLPLYKLLLAFQKHQDYTIVPTKNQDKNVLLKLKYKDTYFISINQLLLDTNVLNYSVIIQNITDSSYINLLITSISSIIYKAATERELKQDSIKYFNSNEKIIKSIKQKSDINIKKLRKQGLNVNAVSCQKLRQPIIVGNSSKKYNNKVITYNNSNYTCPKNDYPYLGVTVDNTLCCFKKNQENKEIYKKFFSSVKDFKPDYTQLEILLNNKYMIKTNKVLDYGRLGTIPIKYKHLKMDKLIRLGNYQNYYSFINIVNILTKKNFEISNITENLYKIIDNGNVAQKMSYEMYRSLLEYNNQSLLPLNHTFILEAVCYILKINLIVVSSDKIDTCISNKNNNYYMILSYKNAYEGIIKNNTEFIFKKDDTIITQIKNLTGFLPSKNQLLNAPQLLYNIDYLQPKYQVVNNSGKVIYLYFKDYSLIPVIPSAVIDNLKSVNINEIHKCIIKFSDQIKKSTAFVKKYPILHDSLSVKGLVLEPASNKVIGIRLNNNLDIPAISENVKESSIKKKNVFYSNIFYNLIEGKDSIDNRIEYIMYYNYLSELYQRFRFLLSQEINNKYKNQITDILNTKYDSVFNKMQSIQKILLLISQNRINKVKSYESIPLEIDLNRKECPLYFCNNKEQLNLKPEDYVFFIQKISNEFINNNTQILDKSVPVEIQNKDDFVIRKDEIILIKDNIINKYFKNKPK